MHRFLPNAKSQHTEEAHPPLTPGFPVLEEAKRLKKGHQNVLVSAPNKTPMTCFGLKMKRSALTHENRERGPLC